MQDLHKKLVAAGVARDWQLQALLYGVAEVIDPLDHRLPANRGNALWLSDQPELALAAYRRAVQLAPRNAVVFRGLGNVHCDRNAFEAADRAYRFSYGLETDPLTAWNHSQLLIGLERYSEGYTLAESRWQLSGVRPWRDPEMAWRGEPEGWTKPLLVWSEQGLGDTLQHLRWLGPLLAGRRSGATPIRLEVESCLVALLQQVLTGVQPQPQVISKPVIGPENWAGHHVSLLSLPLLLGGAPVPKQALWLNAPHWHRSATANGLPLRVGLVWAAGRKLENPVTEREYKRRSLSLKALGDLITGMAQLGIACELLQFGADKNQASPWRSYYSSELETDSDFAATADRVAKLDIVISVDTAMAHLVGAMGREGWVLLPFSAAPRWLRQRKDTPWYPSLRLFRQPSTGDWGAVVQQVLLALQIRLSNRK